MDLGQGAVPASPAGRLRKYRYPRARGHAWEIEAEVDRIGSAFGGGNLEHLARLDEVLAPFQS